MTSCSLLPKTIDKSSSEEFFCSSGFEPIKLNPSEQPLEVLQRIAFYNCQLHKQCGLRFDGDDKCPF